MAANIFRCFAFMFNMVALYATTIKAVMKTYAKKLAIEKKVEEVTVGIHKLAKIAYMKHGDCYP